MADTIDPGLLAQQLTTAPLSQVADTIRRNWIPCGQFAAPYVRAMLQMRDVKDNYGADSGEEIVLRFLVNASAWRGPVARVVKAELNKRVRALRR